MLRCEIEECRYENDAGARFCARCGAELPRQAVAGPVRLRNRDRLKNAEPVAIPLGDAHPTPLAGKPRHWGRAGERVVLFAEAGEAAAAYEIVAATPHPLDCTGLDDALPKPSLWLTAPVYGALAAAVAEPERVRWVRTRTKVAPGVACEVGVGPDERFVGLGSAFGLWLLAVRRTRDGLVVEAGSGESARLAPLATVSGPVEDDAAVFVGGAEWLSGLLPSEAAEAAWAVQGARGVSDLGLKRLWLIVGRTLLSLDLANDRVLASCELGDRGLPALFNRRVGIGAFDPAVAEGANAGLYVSYRDGEGVKYGFVSAANPTRVVRLDGSPVSEGGVNRVGFALNADRSEALLVTTRALVRYGGAQRLADEAEHSLSQSFVPLAAPGFAVALVPPPFGEASETGRRQAVVQIYRQREALERFVQIEVPLPAHDVLPPLFNGRDLQMLGLASDGPHAMVLPITDAAEE